ncbi:MAG: phosphoribosylformylglycinamidine synthase subunit PurQ [Saprospiraceae bacterium]|nr:phosphoribosylformylglycinamidine synthase subunit PurQ [Saprospiraceae bacterium]
MKFGVVVFPGSNCDDDMVHVLGNVMGFDVVKIWHKETSLAPYGPLDGIVLPGGFSYGDYLRSGAIARFSDIMQEVVKFANGGGFVWGICNGFQILCEAGLLPGVLLSNEHKKFICKNVYLETVNRETMLTRGIEEGQILKIPIAHADGRYYIPEHEVNALWDNGQVLFRYCDENGKLTEEANVNGSLFHIAGVCNKEKNVFGMMPHPERAAEDILGNTDGKLLFESLLEMA